MPHQIDLRSGMPITHGGGFAGVPLIDSFIGTITPAPGDLDTGGIVGAIIDIIGGIVGGQGPTTFQFPPAPGGSLPPLPSQNGGFTLGGGNPTKQRLSTQPLLQRQTPQ